MVIKNCLDFDYSFFKRATRATHQTTKYLFLFVLGLAISATDVNAQILQLGSKGGEVIKLQVNLSKQGFYEGSATGLYDGLTEEAVKRFQIAQGLTDDGIAGSRTQDALQKSVSLSATPTQLQSASPTALQSATSLVSDLPRFVSVGAWAFIGFFSFSALINKQEQENKKQTKAISAQKNKPKSFKIGGQTFWNVHGINLGPFDTGTDVEIDIYNPENEKVISYEIHSNVDFDINKFPLGKYNFIARGIHQGEAVEYTETSVNLS
jgi:hypothetical protein